MDHGDLTREFSWGGEGCRFGLAEETGMRKKVLVSLSLVVLIVSAVVVTLLPTAGAKQTLRYKLAFRASEFYNIDANDNGSTDDPGDYQVGEFVMKKGGSSAGHLNFQCVTTSTSPARDLCSAVVHITGKGLVTLSAVQRHGGSNSIITAIDGGTRAFRGASGIVQLDFKNDFITIKID